MTYTIAAVPTKVRTAYASQGINVDAIVERATADQQKGVTVNAGRAWASAEHGPRASVLYMEALLASMKVNGPTAP